MSQIELYHGDCLEVLKNIDKRVNLFLCDLPYGITTNSWDIKIPLNIFWSILFDRLENNGCVVCTASQPFTSLLVSSNIQMFKHEWIWIKNRGSNFANTIREPMKEHESVLVFANRKWKYNRIMQQRTGGGIERSKYLVEHNNQEREGTRKFEGRPHHQISELRVPSSWQKFNVEVGLHPTQKPVSLFKYLIETYTDPNDVVCDPCMGSGSAGIACMETGRRFIGIEKDYNYFSTAKRRIQ